MKIPVPNRITQWFLSHGSFFAGLYFIDQWGKMSQIPNWSSLFSGGVIIMGGFCFSRCHITRRIVDKL